MSLITLFCVSTEHQEGVGGWPSTRGSHCPTQVVVHQPGANLRIPDCSLVAGGNSGYFIRLIFRNILLKMETIFLQKSMNM